MTKEEYLRFRITQEIQAAVEALALDENSAVHEVTVLPSIIKDVAEQVAVTLLAFDLGMRLGSYGR